MPVALRGLELPTHLTAVDDAVAGAPTHRWAAEPAGTRDTRAADARDSIRCLVARRGPRSTFRGGQADRDDRTCRPPDRGCTPRSRASRGERPCRRPRRGSASGRRAHAILGAPVALRRLTLRGIRSAAGRKSRCHGLASGFGRGSGGTFCRRWALSRGRFGRTGTEDQRCADPDRAQQASDPHHPTLGECAALPASRIFLLAADASMR